MITNTECWMQHMRMDEVITLSFIFILRYTTQLNSKIKMQENGMDPEGISIRSVEGMAAADYFVGELLGLKLTSCCNIQSEQQLLLLYCAAAGCTLNPTS